MSEADELTQPGLSYESLYTRARRILLVLTNYRYGWVHQRLTTSPTLSSCVVTDFARWG